MTTNNTTPTLCDCGARAFWTVDGAPACWRCTGESVTVIAIVAVRAMTAGRVFGAGATVPAAFVADCTPVVCIDG